MFQRFRLNNRKGPATIAYKLLHDSLLLLLIFFTLALVAEGVLPGIISNHFGLYKIAILITANVLAIFAAKKIAVIREESVTSKKIAWPLFFVLALLIFNSLLKLNIFLNLFILVFVSITTYFILKTFQEE